MPVCAILDGLIHCYWRGRGISLTP